MRQRLPTALAQVISKNTTDNLLNEIRQTFYLLYEAKEIMKNVYNECNIKRMSFS